MISSRSVPYVLPYRPLPVDFLGSLVGTCTSLLNFWPAELRIRIRDPGLGAFLTPGSGIRDPGWVESQHPDPWSGWTTRIIFLELRNHFFCFFGVKILKFFEDPGSGIRDGKKSDPGSGINPGSSTLLAWIPFLKKSLVINRKICAWN